MSVGALILGEGVIKPTKKYPKNGDLGMLQIKQTFLYGVQLNGFPQTNNY